MTLKWNKVAIFPNYAVRIADYVNTQSSSGMEWSIQVTANSRHKHVQKKLCWVNQRKIFLSNKRIFGFIISFFSNELQTAERAAWLIRSDLA